MKELLTMLFVVCVIKVKELAVEVANQFSVWLKGYFNPKSYCQ